MLMSSQISACLLFISLMPSISGVRCLNVTCCLCSHACIAAASAPAPLFFIAPFTSKLHDNGLVLAL